ncbi:protein kinase [Actinosynnema sp. NPDC059335]|uniref:serine/threonine-protein kinase n=1 Tax=Actinosynnema sp. NPDC059335 TaxID=3346804 RepID=UPI00366D4921
MSLPTSDELLAGRYVLGETLGFGGMAEVRRGWDTVLRREVAVKLFRPNADVDAARRFDNEARTLARLSHPGLVSVHDAGDGDGTPFVVLRLVEGRTLRGRITDGPLSVAEVRELGARLADALAYVHEQGVVHRDVKPSNILLDVHGTPHLADFGLAHLAGATRFTRTDQLVGTAAYLAPEQVRGGDVGPPADVYSFGLVLLECLTGRREYTGGDVEAAVARLHRPPSVPADLPADLVRLLSLMTALSARRRPTARECAEVLRTGEVPAGLAAVGADDPTLDPDDRTLDVDDRTLDVEDATLDVDDRTPDVVPAPRREVPVKALVASAAGLLGAVGVAWALVPGPAPATSSPAPSSTPVVERTTPPADPPEQVVIATTTVAPPVAEDVRPAGPGPIPDHAHKGKGSEKGKGPGKGKP